MLKGVRVLDLSRLLPGPYASLMLADMGAEVIKVEDTGRGDYMRWFPPRVKNESAYYLALNRNKKSIALDLKSEEGKDIFLTLVKSSNAILEGFRPGVAKRLGVGYEDLKKANPKIIFCSLTGYGQEGPYSDMAGHDINYMALSGILGLTGPSGQKPVIPAVQTADVAGGLFAALGIVGALHRQLQTGEGCYLDVAMLDGLVSLFNMHIGRYFATGREEQKGEMMLSGGIVCYNTYATSDDRYIALGALEEKFWIAFCKGVGREDLIDVQMSPAIAENPAYRETASVFKGRTLDEWISFAGKVDCCLTPILNMQEVLKNEQLETRNTFKTIEHSTEGSIGQVAFPIKTTCDSMKRGMSPPPRLGEHTWEILKEAGISEDYYESLRDKGVVK